MINFICFSKDRPLQLHGYLSSLLDNIEDTSDVMINVLLKTEQLYSNAYSDVKLEFSSKVNFVEEVDFRSQLTELVNIDTELICFGCDDAIITGPIHTGSIQVAINNLDLIGISLRLGNHTRYDMFMNQMSQPDLQYQETPNGLMTWNVHAPAMGDWAYPWEVLGTVYDSEFVRRVVRNIQATSPSQLEAQGSQVWSSYTDAVKLGGWVTSKLVVPTVNIIQQEYPNGVTGNRHLEPEFLVDCWNYNLRLDIERYQGMRADSWRIGDFFLKREF